MSVFFWGIINSTCIQRWRCACSGCSSPELKSCNVARFSWHVSNEATWIIQLSDLFKYVFQFGFVQDLSIQHTTTSYDPIIGEHYDQPDLAPPSGPGGTDECCCPNLCIWCFILVPSALYFAFVAPSLVANGIYLLPGGEVDCWRIWLTIC